MCIYPHSGALIKGYGNRQQAPKILRASPSASTLTHPWGLLGEITSVNRQHCSHIIFKCRLLVPRSALSVFSTAHILRVRAIWSLKLLLSDQQRLHIVRVRAPVPQIVSFGPATPWYYSSAGVIVPRITPLGQQRLGIIRVRAFLSLESFLRASNALVLFECGRSYPSNRSFGPAVPWYYSSVGVIVPRIAPSGQQRLGIIRVWALLSLESLLWANSTLVLFERGRYCPSNRSFGPLEPWYYLSAGVTVPRIAPSG
jgi:hypothetical protein